MNKVGQQTYSIEQLKAKNMVVKAVLGGCLCCSAGMPFHVTLNKGIKSHKPDRILNKPAVVGHLGNIKTLLTGQFFQPITCIAPTHRVH